MKVALIIFLAKYYNKIPTEYVSNIRHIFLSFLALTLPVFLVASQPDLGTAMLILVSGVTVIWLAGFRIKYFKEHSDLCLAGEDKSFISKFMTKEKQSIFNPARAQDIFTKEEISKT